MKLVKENLLVKIIFSTLLIPALLLAASLVFAEREARVYLRPIDPIDKTLTVDVNVENVKDLYGAEFQLKYDPAVLSPQDLDVEEDGIQVEIGNLLSADQVFVVANEVDETEGIITFAVSLLNPAPPINENGPLARIVFNVLQNGSATLDLEHAKLVTFDLDTIPSKTTSLTVSRETATLTISGQETNLTSGSEADNPMVRVRRQPYRTRIITETRNSEDDFPWWRIGAMIVMVLGILMLGSILMLGGSSLMVVAAVEKNKTRRRHHPPPVRIRRAVYWSETRH